MSPAPPPAPVRPERRVVDEARARLRAAADEAARLGPGRRIAAAWMLGLGCLCAGEAIVRTIGAFLPSTPGWREPPPLAIAYLVAGGVAWAAGSVALRRGARIAPGIVVLAVVGLLAGTYVALNTSVTRPLPDDTTRPLAALAEAWRGVGWAGMLAHARDFRAAPGPGWEPAALGAMAFTTAVGGCILGLLPRRRPSDGGSEPRGTGLRIVGYVVSVHLAAHTALTFVALLGAIHRALRLG